MGKPYYYWIATHSIEHCILCPTRISPVLKRSVITGPDTTADVRVLSDNGCTTWVPRNKLFKTPEEAWADYRKETTHG